MNSTKQEEIIEQADLSAMTIEPKTDHDQENPRGGSSSADAREEVCASLPLTARVEALLFSTERPLAEARLAELIGLKGKGVTKAVIAAIDELNREYEHAQRSFRAERLAGGWQLMTLPAFGPVLNRLHVDRQQSRLSQPALETLAIIAYRQPIMRAEIEAIRGVASGEVLRGLLERRMVKIVGRAEELGRPMLYGTTREFLQVFGLSGCEDLPPIQGLSNSKPAAAPAALVPAQAVDAPTALDDATDVDT